MWHHLAPSVKNNVLITLVEPINDLVCNVRNVASKQASELPENGYLVRPPVQLLDEYNHIPFFEMLLNDIFNGYRTDSLTGISPSTYVLINDGIESASARTISLLAFNSVISILGIFIPDINFTTDKYRYEFINKYDVSITMK